MFETLRKFIGDLVADPASPREFGDNDHRLAAAALLVHVADADGKVEPEESTRLRRLLAERFSLDSGQSVRLIDEARRSDHEAVSLDHFVNVLKRVLDADGRLKLVEMMWDIVYADGEASETEDSIVWRIAGMIGVSEEDREILRRSRAPGHWPGPPAGRDS